MQNKIKMLDLFAGCGGLTDGFMQTNCFDDIAAVEWKKSPVATLRKRLATKWDVEVASSNLVTSTIEAKMRGIASHFLL